MDNRHCSCRRTWPRWARNSRRHCSPWKVSCCWNWKDSHKNSKFSINLHIIEYWISEGPQSHRKWVFNGNWWIDFSLSNILSQLITTRYHRNRAKSSSVHSRCLHRQHRRHHRHRPTHAHRRWTSCVEKRKNTRLRYFTVSMQSPCLASTFHRWVSIMPWHRIIVAKRAITSRPTISTSSPLITTITIIA